MPKLKKWDISDYIKSRVDLVELLWAGLDEIKDANDKKDFEYLLFLCEDVLRLAKERGWDTRTQKDQK